MEFRIADSFTAALGKLTRDEQKAVKTSVFDLQTNPEHPGLQWHRIGDSKDPNFWSCRAGRDVRIIVHKTAQSFLLAYVGHHDDAYPPATTTCLPLLAFGLGTSWPMEGDRVARLDPEIGAYARQLQREEEAEDINAFVDAYPRATGETLELVDTQESPGRNLLAAGRKSYRGGAHARSALARQGSLGFDRRATA